MATVRSFPHQLQADKMKIITHCHSVIEKCEDEKCLKQDVELMQCVSNVTQTRSISRGDVIC